MSQEVDAARDQYIDEFARFVEASPSSYHAAYEIVNDLGDAGFVEYGESESWPALRDGARGVVRRDGAVIAWRAGVGVRETSPVRILGCHTDSPGFVLKPEPDVVTEGWSQAGVEVYGGPLLNSWLDRDLSFAGRVVTRAGEEVLVDTCAIARIPQLAIHLDREANHALTLDRQRHTQPVIAAGVTSISEHIAHTAGVDPEDVAGTDIRLADTQPPARFGVHREFLASPRLDNLSSSYAGLHALIAAEPAPGTITVLAAFDHEELGSETRSGASGPFLEDVLERLWAGLGASRDERARALADSWCLSADAGHAVHPNYGEKHDPNVRPQPGRGPMLKVNANQRYATDAHGSALWARACADADVATQVFVSNNAIACGSTIGPLTATRIGIRTVDVGVPLLSMHSAREMVHVDDLYGLAMAVAAFFRGA